MGKSNRFDDDTFEDEDFDAFAEGDEDEEIDSDLTSDDVMEDQWLDGSYEPAECE